MLLEDVLTIEIAANPLQAWFIAAGVTLAVFAVFSVIRSSVVHRLRRLNESSSSFGKAILQAVIQRTASLFLLLIALFLASLTLSIPDGVHNIFIKVVTLAWLLQGGLWISATLRVLLEYYQQEQESKDPAGASMINVLGLLGRILLWSLVLLLALDNLGVNITALVTGLGIGGIAIALAVQTVLSDLLASLSIVLDKPFTLGDFLIIGEHMGSVEYIGLKTTRIRSLSGEQLVFSNADLLQSRIRNFGRMFERRVVFKIGVTYQTPRERLTEIPGIIRAAIESQDKTRFDRSHFVSYGDFSLVFETVYYVLGADYNLYMDIQQAINLYIHERFEEQNIEFAYPTQTVFLQREQQQQSAPA
jgi:small-conductance mechanosensitive channel